MKSLLFRVARVGALLFAGYCVTGCAPSAGDGTSVNASAVACQSASNLDNVQYQESFSNLISKYNLSIDVTNGTASVQEGTSTGGSVFQCVGHAVSSASIAYFRNISQNVSVCAGAPSSTLKIVRFYKGGVYALGSSNPAGELANWATTQTKINDLITEMKTSCNGSFN